MSKKKSGKILKHKKPASKRWMRAVGGYSSLKFASLFVFGIGFLALAAVSVWYVKSQRVEFTPLPSISHTNEIPDTNEVLNLINKERQTNRKAELAADEKLNAVAERRLREMVDAQEYSHKNQDGKFYYDLLREHEYFSAYSCENLDIESTARPATFIKSWMESSGGHKECLLNDKVERVGIAAGRFSTNDDKRDSFLVVVIFASSPTEQPND